MTPRPRTPSSSSDGGSSPRPRRARRTASGVRSGEASTREVATAGRVKVTAPDPSLPTATVRITRKPGMPKAEFDRKLNRLVQLGEEGKLFKATNPVDRDPSVTASYRQDMIRRIHEQYGQRNPEFSEQLIQRVTSRMQPDHVWELQLGGPDNWGNLKFLDGFTNQDIGMHQIRPQIAKLPDGTPIRIEVVDE